MVTLNALNKSLNYFNKIRYSKTFVNSFVKSNFNAE